MLSTDSLLYTSATTAKANFGHLVHQVTHNGKNVVVKSYGQPKIVIISFDEYRQFNQIKQSINRQKALQKLEKLRDVIQDRNSKLSKKTADRLVDRFTRDVIQNMIKHQNVD